MKLSSAKWLLTLGGGLIVMLGAGLTFLPGSKVNFNAEIRPLINTRCISCHGGVKQSGELSFLTREDALKPAQSGLRAIVPGKPEKSELIRRITHTDPDERMPLDHEPLKAEEVALFRRWIKQGAEWADHWSFIAPKSDITPPKAPKDWVKTGIDNFIYDRLRHEGLSPAEEADKRTLIRRLSLDLTGLPPTLTETDAFLKDSLPGNYERLADHLLASPHFGERWAAHWMDLARYADSKGYEKDDHRDLWPWRDWLIKAFNEDKPFDQFSIEQLAGDLLPNAGTDQIIATAFHRSALTNTEGGTDDEEFRVAAIIDRVKTTWTVWQGLTMECVQCHSHPYEPIRHKEYYQFMAYFNNSQDNDLDDDFPVYQTFAAKDTAEFERIIDWIQQQQPTFEDPSGQPVNGRIKRALWPRVQPRDCDDFREVSITGDGAASNWVHNLQAGSKRLFYLRFNQLDFDQITHISLTYAATGNKALVELRTDAPDGPLLAEFHPKKTGQYIRGNEGWWNDPHKKAKLALKNPAGAHDLFVLLHNPDGIVPDGIVVLKELEFHGKNIPVLAPKALAAQDSLLKYRLRAANMPVMRERQSINARKSHVFERGSWLTPGEEVRPGVPASLPPLKEGASADRLGMAQWLLSPENPLTARVTVNRFWEQIFGTGIVETVEDFGSQGAKPSHPELLDWLAHRFVHEHQWSMKALLREMVCSATYRQSAVVSPEKRAKDPYNHLLSRGARTRLTAEQVRDQALAVSGLLSHKLYGPSVKPWQPDGVWKIVYSGDQWIVSEGEDAYRRALYTYWRRSSPYPSFINFDGATRDFCMARRIRTNTPLQALTTLNDPVYHEAAVALAERMLREGGIAWGYRRALLHEPSAQTLAALQQLHDSSLTKLKQDLRAAADMACNERSDSPEVAAMAVVANAIMNLDVFLNK